LTVRNRLPRKRGAEGGDKREEQKESQVLYKAYKDLSAKGKSAGSSLLLTKVGGRKSWGACA